MGLASVDLSYQKEIISQDTWGHLVPEQNRTYRGRIIFSKSVFYCGNNPIINFEFNGLDSSPWLFEALENEIKDLDLEEGKAYKMNVTFRNYRFWFKLIESF